MATKAEQASTEPKFFLHELREHCRTLFDVKPEVFDGVFYNCKESQITKTEAKKKIDTFLKREVKGVK